MDVPMRSEETMEEQLRRAGVDLGTWGAVDLAELSSPPRSARPARRSRRRLSGVQPCSSHRMTLRRRSAAAPLSPVERSLGALQLDEAELAASPCAARPPPAPELEPKRPVTALEEYQKRPSVAAEQEPKCLPPNAEQEPKRPAPTPEEEPKRPLVAPEEEPKRPASARQSSRRRSLGPLNPPPPSAAARRAGRRRSAGPGCLPPPLLPDEESDKENGSLARTAARPPESVLFDGYHGSAASPELGRRCSSAVELRLGPSPQKALHVDLTEKSDGGRSEPGSQMDSAGAGEDEVQWAPEAVQAAPRKETARRYRRRSAGAVYVPPPESPGPALPERPPSPPENPLPAPLDAALSPESDLCRAEPSASAPAEQPFPLPVPSELEDVYLNRNYAPPRERPLATIVEEGAAPPAGPPRRGLRRRAADMGKVRKCTMELTPAKERLRQLRARRVRGLNKAAARKARPRNAKRALDARLRELDQFYAECDAAWGDGSEVGGGAQPSRTPRAETEPESTVSSWPQAEVEGPEADHPAPGTCREEPMETECAPAWDGAPPLPDLDRSLPAACSAARYDPLDVSQSSVPSMHLELSASSVESGDRPPGESPVISGGGELRLGPPDAPESESPVVGRALNVAVLMSPSDEDTPR